MLTSPEKIVYQNYSCKTASGGNWTLPLCNDISVMTDLLGLNPNEFQSHVKIIEHLEKKEFARALRVIMATPLVILENETTQPELLNTTHIVSAQIKNNYYY